MKKVKIATSSDGYHYLFSCVKCQKQMELITGMGRYGNLGEFHCPYCSKKYYATIDDHPNPKCYIFEIGEQPLISVCPSYRNLEKLPIQLSVCPRQVRHKFQYNQTEKPFHRFSEPNCNADICPLKAQNLSFCSWTQNRPR